MSWLYRYEAKGIQSYILGSTKLREIKGGSVAVERLSELLEHALEAFGAGKPLMTAAGSATVRFEHEVAARGFARSWPMLVDRFAPNLQVVQAIAKESDGADLLHDRLRRARNVGYPELPQAGPATFRTPRTGLPACDLSDAGERERVDRGLRRRQLLGRDSAGDVVGRRLDEHAHWALDLEKDIGPGYVAIIHADGNDLGNKIRNVPPDRLPDFSKALSKLTENAARQAVAAVREENENENENEQRRLPMRPVVLGGDDLTMITRGDLGLRFATSYLEAFERLAAEKKLLRGLTACAGVAVVAVSYPFDRAHELAEQLCAFAKRNLRERGAGGATATGLAFHRVTTSLTGSYDDIVARELTADKGLLTMQPYVLGGAKGCPSWRALERLADALGKLPRSPVREALRLMTWSPERASDRLRRTGELHRESWGHVCSALAELGCEVGAESGALGWCAGASGEERTPLLDAWTWWVTQRRGDDDARD